MTNWHKENMATSRFHAIKRESICLEMLRGLLRPFGLLGRDVTEEAKLGSRICISKGIELLIPYHMLYGMHLLILPGSSLT